MQQKITKPSSDTIFYDTAHQLTWKDFRGTPVQHDIAGAVTSSGYAFDADVKVEGKVIYMNIGVYAFFSKRNSWKKTNIITDYHLLHEQNHFNITQISAEKFIDAVAKAKFTRDNYQSLINKLFDETYDECNRLQEQYDRETRHSLNREVQLKWNDQIAAMLKQSYLPSSKIHNQNRDL